MLFYCVRNSLTELNAFNYKINPSHFNHFQSENFKSSQPFDCQIEVQDPEFLTAERIRRGQLPFWFNEHSYAYECPLKWPESIGFYMENEWVISARPLVPFATPEFQLKA